MTALYENQGLTSPAFEYMNVNYDNILGQIFEGIPVWDNLITTMNYISDNNVHYARDQLYNLRSYKSDTKYVNYNIFDYGYRINLSNTINPIQSANLYKNLSTFLLTKGASTVFLDFIGFIENTAFTFIPLWADSLTNTPTDLTDTPGTYIWDGGTYFPTPYFDIAYNEADYPSLNETLFVQLLQPIIPIHLVLRAFVTSATGSVTLYSAVAILEESEITCIMSYA
jgi:hypothetical protein